MYIFEKQIPSVFVIETPLQAIFAVQAIRDFQINQYLVLVWETVRFHQVAAVLNYFEIKFQIEDMELITNKKEWLKALFRLSPYKRAFIGFPKMHMLFCACRYLSSHSTIILLDDGLATVKLFKKGKLLDFDTWFIKPFSWLTRIKNVTYNKHVYTIFSDLPHHGFHIQRNSMSLLSNIKEDDKAYEVYIIGTNPSPYSQSIGLDLTEFYSIQKRIMSEIRNIYPSYNLYYIPHGGDVSNVSKEICAETGWHYKKVEMTIEMYFLQKTKMPEKVFGFLSTALYVIKKMFPKMDVTNIAPNGTYHDNISEDHLYLIKYYMKHGIVSVDEHLMPICL